MVQFWDHRLDALYRHWWSKGEGGGVPLQAALAGPALFELRPILNWIDLSPGGQRFRHRSVGSETVSWLQRDAGGQDIAEGLYGAAAAEIQGTLRDLVAERRPYRRRAHLRWHRRAWLTMESLELPLRDEWGNLTIVLRASSFFPIASRLSARLEYLPLAPPA
jgi:hypothetical protein